MAEIHDGQKKITDCFQKKDKKFDEDTKCPPKISSDPSHDAAPALKPAPKPVPKPAPKPSSFEVAPKKKDFPLPVNKAIDLTKRKALYAEYKQERKLTSERAEKLASKHTLEKNQVTKYFQRLREADPSYEKRSYSTKKSREPVEQVLINAFNESTVLSEQRAKDLGKETGLTPSQVQHWFARRREEEEKQTIRPETLNAIQEAALEDAFQESPILSDSRAEALAESLKCTLVAQDHDRRPRRPVGRCCFREALMHAETLWVVLFVVVSPPGRTMHHLSVMLLTYTSVENTLSIPVASGCLVL